MQSPTHFSIATQAADHDKELLDALLEQDNDAEALLLDFDPHGALLQEGPGTPSDATACVSPDVLSCVLPAKGFRSLATNQSLSTPETLPSTSTTTSAWTLTVESANTSTTSMTEREIRQMKNRESANKSLWRRKAQLSSLTAEVKELTTKQQELHVVIAGLRAENKTLHDQNAFLRTLATEARQEPRGARTQLAATESGTVTSSASKSGQHTEKDEVADATDTDASEDI